MKYLTVFVQIAISLNNNKIFSAHKFGVSIKQLRSI